MMIAAITMAFVAGLLIGFAIAWDKAFIAGKRWGQQLRAEQHEGDDIMARIRRVM